MLIFLVTKRASFQEIGRKVLILENNRDKDFQIPSKRGKEKDEQKKYIISKNKIKGKNFNAIKLYI